MRKVYSLSELGLLRCKDLLKTRDTDVLLPMCINHCNPDDFDSLDDCDRDVLKYLMILRTPVRMEEVPGGRKVPLMPVNHCEFVLIKRSISGMHVRKADRETLRRWHNLAADHCDDIHERLYHLVICRRLREASKLTWAHGHKI